MSAGAGVSTGSSSAFLNALAEEAAVEYNEMLRNSESESESKGESERESRRDKKRDSESKQNVESKKRKKAHGQSRTTRKLRDIKRGKSTKLWNPIHLIDPKYLDKFFQN